MMVETILESSQDFGMSGGSLPQWKRELLQRRAARARPPAHPAALPAAPPAPPLAPPPPPPPDDDEELRYGPGIVKRLKSRYLSLALRDAPRRRPSAAAALRRATSLEHLLDERPPPPPSPAPRPAARARPVSGLPAPALRRDSVKRARSVDALSRLDARDEPCPPSPPPPAPRPPQTRAARPPRRPVPLLRDAERPPPDVVRSALRKFESAPTRRPAPAARVSAVLRGLEPLRTSTPEPRDGGEAPPLPSPRSPSPRPPTEPPPPPPANTEEHPGVGARLVSRAALDGIARAGSSVRFAFEAPRAGSHLPPLAAANPVLLGRARRVGVIRPMPARGCDDVPVITTVEASRKSQSPTRASPSPTPPSEVEQPSPARSERKDPPPAALVEPIPRPAPALAPPETPPPSLPERAPSPDPRKPEPKPEVSVPLVNGHSVIDCSVEVKSVVSKIGAAGIERAWSGSWAGAGAGGGGAGVRRGRAAPPASTSVVFNFSNRKEVPDYIENDGIILRNKKNRFKPGEPGVVVLRPEALARADSDSEEGEADSGPPSPCRVRFLNDNVLINGKSSMPAAHNRDRIAKLKLQFDDSLTRTFEYPSETSLCEDSPADPPAASDPSAPSDPPASEPPAPQLAESPLLAQLAANTHISSAALSSYTPSKTRADVFQLGVTRHADLRAKSEEKDQSPAIADSVDEPDGADSCADAARSWSEARTHHTDLLF